ncbi:MAG: hypothetical protein EZS26_002380 [Candidatus Ordinivivax streblomastigis]|uniref:Uncharacterized protein n=1 Tax=Candidatus Ordinivivax streblomastigis TaxID=2540710 RepID=A0A5M8NZE6_9BACT|nr:MAG: hypothetical protein EZS26_002380 [Candidatus Ordinivivax streblomastigis]
MRISNLRRAGAGNTRTINILDIGPYETIAKQPTGLQDFTGDPVIETKYYNLQGWEMQRPLQEGIFIVKRKHASERIEVTKVYGRPESFQFR